MAYDEDLAQRIRALVGTQGGILVRVGADRSDQLLATTKASVAAMGGRPTPGWLRVGAEAVGTKRRAGQVGRSRSRFRSVVTSEGLGHLPK